MMTENDGDSELYCIKSDVCCGNETGGDQVRDRGIEAVGTGLQFDLGLTDIGDS